MAPPPPPPAELIDDATAEILLRLPPDDPACLLRASLVCKLWHCILSDPTFPDRYREFHGTPPLLGFLSDAYNYGYNDESGRGFIPVTSTRGVPFRQPAFRCRALDCRHGRVLLDKVGGTGTTRKSLVVWDPVTGDHRVLSHPVPRLADPFGQCGAVVCAAAGCDHRGCGHGGGGPFHVVIVSNTSYIYNHGTGDARAWVYSSQTAAWSAAVATVQIQYAGIAKAERKRAAIVGDQIYFLLSPGAAGILKYDLGKRCLTVIGSPCMDTYMRPGILMTTKNDGGSLGFVGVKEDDSTLHLWRATTKVNHPNGSSMGWVYDRVISLDKLVPNIWCNQVVNVVGFAEGMDVLLVSVGEAGRGFMFELKSGRIRKLTNPVFFYYGDYFPYLSFYIPDFASHKWPRCQRRQNNNSVS